MLQKQHSLEEESSSPFVFFFCKRSPYHLNSIKQCKNHFNNFPFKQIKNSLEDLGLFLEHYHENECTSESQHIVLDLVTINPFFNLKIPLNWTSPDSKAMQNLWLHSTLCCTILGKGPFQCVTAIHTHWLSYENQDTEMYALTPSLKLRSLYVFCILLFLDMGTVIRYKISLLWLFITYSLTTSGSTN